MDIEEIRKRRKELEVTIASLLDKFYTETSVPVTNLSVNRHITTCPDCPGHKHDAWAEMDVAATLRLT